MRYEFIASHRNQYAVERMCRTLSVGRSGYYAWQSRPTSARAQANQALVLQIREAHQASKQTYGSPRIQAVLRRKGVVCGRNRVARLMQLHGIAARRPHRRVPLTTRRDPRAIPATNLLKRDFSASAPNRKWVTDITYIDTAEGWLYLASVMDLFSRKIVGWAMADHMETSLIQEALEMAMLRRKPPFGLLHHSDQGRQYTSAAYQAFLAARHCQVSMSQVGNCFDNAPMESFFATLKTECAKKQFSTRAQARVVIFEYIEAWYNRQRLHSSLDYLSPLEFEQNSGH
jgi:transposase InsO family protein